MPIYEFRCPAGHTKESFVRTLDAPSARALCFECATEGRDTWMQRAFISPPAIKVHEGPGNWNVKTADGKYRVTDFKEAEAEVAYQRSRSG